MEILNNIGSLKTLSHNLMVASVIFAIAAALSTGIRYYVDRHLNNLSSSARLADEAALKRETEALKKELGPRQLKRNAAIAILLGQPKLPVEILYLRDDPECFQLAQEIENVLREAKWTVISRSPIPSTNFDGPNSMGVSGQPSGVTVAAHGITQAEADASLNSMIQKEWVRTPFTVLQHALGEGLGKISSWASGPNAPPPDRLRVIVSPR